MTTTDDAAFLRAICEDPADDAPRLVYADWLDDRDGDVACPDCDGRGWSYDDSGGNIGVQAHCLPCNSSGRVGNGFAERAEFVRLQIKVAEFEREAGHPLAYGCKCGPCVKAGPVRARARSLLADFPAAPYWLGKDDPFVRSHPHRDVESDPIIRAFGKDVRPILFGFQRGMIRVLAIETAAFLEHAAAIFAAHPVERVVLTDAETYLSPEAGYVWLKESRRRYEEPAEGYVPDEIQVLCDGCYGSQAAALDALSAAAVAFARQLAGLPPLVRTNCSLA